MGTRGVNEVLKFWFDSLQPQDWFAKSDRLDQQIAQCFGALHQRLVSTKDDALLQSPEQALVAVIVLDQFSRNLFRDQPEAFAQDDKALAIARAAIERQWDQLLPPRQRAFLYMPFMHSERLEDHEQAMALFTELGNEKNLEFERKHKVIIERFGRYPHRNAVLGRESTPEERAFLTQPGSSF
ncbi:DUF924 family protein [Gilvimarinus algae]|uniref:DUF924 family protein n=1 Tax=Gilvimarinus algae TaxID=3058037 RepID=A0ABT8TBN2_9GAMM|nr:DUF924 family protein [Gilvimarinus sp. SDUM040014]MDO3381055.1 DUF924 family protein [Gilvimarinus sp. SDUM040014]